MPQAALNRRNSIYVSETNTKKITNVTSDRVPESNLSSGGTCGAYQLKNKSLMIIMTINFEVTIDEFFGVTFNV